MKTGFSRFIFKNVMAVATATAVFLFTLFFLDLNFLVSSILGLLGYGAGVILFGAWGGRNLEIDIAIHGLSKSQIDEAINGSAERVAEIRSAAKKIRDESIAEQIEGICVAADAIVENFRKDPKDIRAGRQFIHYYLEATRRIVDRYVELSLVPSPSEDMKRAMNKAEDLLSMIKGAFEKQLTLLMQDQVLDLDSEIDLLKKTLKMEGL